MKNIWLWIVGAIVLLFLVFRKKKVVRHRSVVRIRRNRLNYRTKSRLSIPRKSAGKIYRFKGRSTRNPRLWAKWMRDAKKRKR